MLRPPTSSSIADRVLRRPTGPEGFTNQLSGADVVVCCAATISRLPWQLFASPKCEYPPLRLPLPRSTAACTHAHARAPSVLAPHVVHCRAQTTGRAIVHIHSFFTLQPARRPFRRAAPSIPARSAVHVRARFFGATAAHLLSEAASWSCGQNV